MKKLTSKEIRKIWINFFKTQNHYFLPSSSLIPFEDDSLLWINSGIAVLKKYFSGLETPPNKRIVNIQKAIRTNDIENVGVTSRHHTFFEMLGNFSIGDYFKQEAIDFAWELLTSSKYFGIDQKLLFITVFKDDDEAYQTWIKKGVKKEQIIKMGRKTNFWDMGIGPSGPSTEIFFDRGLKYGTGGIELIKNDLENDRYVEIWNIVFSQFNNDGKDNYLELPQKNIDTGAGLERLASCLQDTPTNFETDLFKPLIKVVESYSTKKYLYNYVLSKLKVQNPDQFQINLFYKRIVDFFRSSAFAISDGAVPSANGRGYVIRRSLRKIFFYITKLEIENESIFEKLLNELIKIMGETYSDLIKHKAKILETIKTEETTFKKTLTKGLEIFEKQTSTPKQRAEFNEKKAFKLYETYGVPLDIIEDLAVEKKIKLDRKKIDKLYNEFIELSKDSFKNQTAMNLQNDLFINEDATNFIGYKADFAIGTVLAIQNDYVVFDQTPFYATSGGQVNDTGWANKFEVIDVVKTANKVFIHQIRNHKFKIGDKVSLKINKERRKKITINHSATHLLFSAIEKIYQQKMPQVGSKVDENYLRFDFSTQEKISQPKLLEANELANKWIKNKTKTIIKEIKLEEAKKMGATFLTSKTYGKLVRVVKLNNECIDLCGGTHVKNLDKIEEILITSFKRRGSGVYRIEAITGTKNIKNYQLKQNQEFLTTQLEIVNEKIKNFKDKYFALSHKNPNLEQIDNLIKQIKDEKMTIANYQIKISKLFQNLNKVLNNEHDKLTEIVEQKIIETLNQNKNKVKIHFQEVKLNEVNKFILKQITNFESKMLIAVFESVKNITVALFVSQDLINNSKLVAITKDLNKIGLKGNGSRQLYIFGGSNELKFNLKRYLLTWE